MRGFTFSYPAAQAAQLTRVAIAVANLFEPFPAAGAAAVSAAATPAPSSGAPAAIPQPAATALVIAPGKALTAS